jgi:hypothetical protein
MKKTIFSLLGIFAFLIFSHLNAFACNCPTVIGVEQELKWKLKQLAAVFSGKVIEINKIPQSRDVSVKIEVKEIWKGLLSKEANIATPEHTGACGVSFEVGKSYLVFASHSAEGNLITGLCLNDKELEKASEELEILGKGKKPKSNKSSSK